jgi:hypothetical protein
MAQFREEDWLWYHVKIRVNKVPCLAPLVAC